MIELVDQRNHQHRPSSIAVALIERDPLLEVRVALQVVYVGDDDGLLGEGGVPNQTGVVHRIDRHRRVGHVINGIELVQNGMQPLAAVPIGFEQDQPASVAVGEPLPLHDNLAEQGFAVMLAHESNADPAQLLEFLLGMRCRRPYGGQKTGGV